MFSVKSLVGRYILWMLVCSAWMDLSFGKMLVNLMLLQQYPNLINEIYFMGDIVIGFVGGTAGAIVLGQQMVKLFGSLPKDST